MTRINLARPYMPAYRTVNNAKANYSPKVNIVENDNEFQLELAVPGIKKEAISINYENGKLMVSYQAADTSKDSKYVHREFSDKSFEKSFTVSAKKIETEQIEANYNDGILNITLPKKEEAKIKPARQIAVS